MLYRTSEIRKSLFLDAQVCQNLCFPPPSPSNEKNLNHKTKKQHYSLFALDTRGRRRKKKNRTQP